MCKLIIIDEMFINNNEKRLFISFIILKYKNKKKNQNVKNNKINIDFDDN
jgi:hypothetical protein